MKTRCYLIVLILLLFPVFGHGATVSTVSGLKTAVTNANNGGDATIVLAGGVYNLNGSYLRITREGVSLSGATGNPADVILDGNYATSEIIQVAASNTTIRALTLQKATAHPIHVVPATGDLSNTQIVQVHIIDPGQQAIKINQDGNKLYSAVSGTIRDSFIELTDSGREKVWQINGECYTGGIDGHHALGWTVQDNLIQGFWCAGGLSEHGVHFWSLSTDTLVERNTIVNCDRGIGFGLGDSGHTRGIIRNNMIYHDTGHAYSDVGIGLENASNAQVYNNTIYHEHDYPYAIEYRFAGTTGGTISNNLTNKAIQSRDGGSSQLARNITSALPGWFVFPASGNLHLSGDISGVVDGGIALAALQDDIDGDSRPMGSGIDIGADEYVSGSSGSQKTMPWLLLLQE